MKKQEPHIKVETCQFVCSSDLFNGLDKLRAEFCESDPPFSWGNNNRSLVTSEAILDHLDGCAIDNVAELKRLRKRVDTLPEAAQTYVDLEN